ncbi:MAG: molybdenum cofactor biosynthesis protein MoaE [Fimbriimonadaceae bacterium]
MSNVHVALVEEPIDVGPVMRAVQDDTLGGVVVFLGDVRRVTQGVATDHLDYEAHVEMALKVMREIGTSAAAEFAAKVAIVHRLGKLMPGETSVVCAAACAHRAQAFDCCRQLIDRLKLEVPIWKKESGPTGGAWVT